MCVLILPPQNRIHGKGYYHEKGRMWSSLSLIRDKSNNVLMVDDCETVVVPFYLTKVKAKLFITEMDNENVPIQQEIEETFLFNKKLSERKIITMLYKLGYSKWELLSVKHIQLKADVKYDHLAQCVQKEGYKYE